MPSRRKKKSPAAQRPARGALMTAVIIAAIASNASKRSPKSDPKTLAAVELVSQYFELIVIIIIPSKFFWDTTCINACSSLVQDYRRKRLSIKQGLLARPVTLPCWHVPREESQHRNPKALKRASWSKHADQTEKEEKDKHKLDRLHVDAFTPKLGSRRSLPPVKSPPASSGRT